MVVFNFNFNYGDFCSKEMGTEVQCGKLVEGSTSGWRGQGRAWRLTLPGAAPSGLTKTPSGESLRTSGAAQLLPPTHEGTEAQGPSQEHSESAQPGCFFQKLLHTSMLLLPKVCSHDGFWFVVPVVRHAGLLPMISWKKFCGYIHPSWRCFGEGREPQPGSWLPHFLVWTLTV